MSLKNREFLKSIRFKFILWYTFILAATFLLFSVILYVNFRSSLEKSLDSRLLSKAEGIVNSIDTYWETEKMEAIKDEVKTDVFSKINNLNFVKIAQRWVKEKSSDPELLNFVVQIYNPQGEIIASSENLPGIIRFSGEELNAILKGANKYEDRAILIEKEKSTPFRVLTVAVFENEKVAYIVRVASPMIALYTALNRLKVILFLLLPLTVAIASLIAGEFLASVTLKPLKKMIAIVRKITAQNLNLRISIPKSKDEINQLAETFNNMLEKIDKSFVSQRQFIQDVSHELRTPLTIIKGELEVALKKARSQEEYSAILRSNLEEVNKITRIVENLLTLIRFDNEGFTLKLEQLDLAQLIKDIAADIELLAQQKSIKIDVDCAQALILNADKEKITRLFLNILDNAIKYTPEKGKVCIKAQKGRGNIIVEVSDSGIGIPKEELPFIFDRFYRIDKSRSDFGFGLGLSIAKSIVDAHKGSIEAQSGLGLGTTFSICLPYLPASP